MSTVGGTTLSGSDVTFYNTQGGGYAYNAISLSSGSRINLTAPTSRNVRIDSVLLRPLDPEFGLGLDDHRKQSVVVEGALYLPTVNVTFTGNSNLAAYTIIVANRISATGNSTFNRDYSSLSNGSPIKTGGGVTVG